MLLSLYKILTVEIAITKNAITMGYMNKMLLPPIHYTVKGFTLIELLVVMGILGVLMAVTILVINPAEYLKRSRDTQRISDIQTVHSAVSLAVASGVVLGSHTNCYATIAATPAVICNGGASVSPTVGDRTATGATGWVHGVDISSSFGALPIDPSSSASTFFYLWAISSSTYELNVATLESVYYVTTNPVAANDGGNANASCVAGTFAATCRYEIGTSLTLIP
jgi:prepilin-type N-terminal cleavage/methylation domain-containing protein